jgi:hypothetical protein
MQHAPNPAVASGTRASHCGHLWASFKISCISSDTVQSNFERYKPLAPERTQNTPAVNGNVTTIS